MSTAVQPILQLAATFSLMASGSFQHCVGNDFLIGLSQSALCKISNRVLKEMECKLCPNNVKFEPEDSFQCIESFSSKYNIPGGILLKNNICVTSTLIMTFPVIGCIDGTHIGMQKPCDNEHMFFNRSGYHSLNIMIVNHFY